MTVIASGHGGLHDLRRTQPVFAGEIDVIAAAAGVDPRYVHAYFAEVFTERPAPMLPHVRKAIEAHATVEVAPIQATVHARWLVASAASAHEREGGPGARRIDLAASRRTSHGDGVRVQLVDARAKIIATYQVTVSNGRYVFRRSAA